MEKEGELGEDTCILRMLSVITLMYDTTKGGKTGNIYRDDHLALGNNIGMTGACKIVALLSCIYSVWHGVIPGEVWC